MRILVDAIVMELPPTGIAKTTLGLYQGCLKLLSSLQVEFLHRQPLAAVLSDGMRSMQWGSNVPGRLWRPLMIPLAVTAKRPAAVHFPWNGNVPKPLPGAKVVTTLHDILPLEIPAYFPSDETENVYRRQKQRDIDRTDLLVTVSEYSKTRIMTHFRVYREPIVVHHGCSLCAGNRLDSSPVPQTGEYFLYVGGYDPRKGMVALLDVFIALSQEERITSKLILTGQKHYFSEAFEQLVKKGSQLGIVEELGYVSDARLATLLANAKALVYPSKYEGFGLPVLEAMTLGCPVITTNHTSIPEVCGKAAYYIEPDDKRNFAEGLIALDSDAELRRRMSVEGKKQAEKFSWEKSATKFLEALSQTLLREDSVN